MSPPLTPAVLTVIDRDFPAADAHLIRAILLDGCGHDLPQIPPPDEIERIRLERAQDLLARDPDITLAAVAGATGFTDASHLVRRFRLRHGVTPAAWRRHHQSLASPA